MSYTLDLIVARLPLENGDAWKAVEDLRSRYYGDPKEKAPLLVKLHEKLTERYPCLCSYVDDDPAMEDSPWADGPLINNFSSEMGMVAIVFSKVDEAFPFVVQTATGLGITVADGQTGAIYHPGGEISTPVKKPWWKFW